MLLFLSLAFAQAPTDPDPIDFEFAPAAPNGPVDAQGLRSEDPVFLAPLQAIDPLLRAEGVRLDGILRAGLQPLYRISTIEVVPPWPDYSAEIYMSVCPEGQYAGCAQVTGDRINTRWSVGGTMTRIPTGVNVDLVFIDNLNSRELIRFSVALNGQNDAELIQGVDTIMSQIVMGAFAAVDLRIVDSDPAEKAKLEKAQRDVLAASLADLEKQEGDVERQRLEAQRQKLSKSDLEAMRAGEQTKPWEAVDMSEGEYRRYSNSGKMLAEWRRLRRGKFGQLIGRLSIGGGVGPFGQYMDGRYTRDDNLQIVHREQYQFVSQASHFDVDFELGFGVLPFLEITGLYSVHNGQFRYVFSQEKVGDPVFVDPEAKRTIGSSSLGIRATMDFFQTKPVRPTIHTGLTQWTGTSWNRIIGGLPLEDFERNTLLLAVVGAGGELTTGKYIDLFARGQLDMPIGGRRSQVFTEGGGALQIPADVSTFQTSNIGFSFHVGVTGRLTLIKGKERAAGSSIRFEEEAEGL